MIVTMANIITITIISRYKVRLTIIVMIVIIVTMIANSCNGCATIQNKNCAVINSCSD
jgi:hypothetical protein